MKKKMGSNLMRIFPATRLYGMKRKTQRPSSGNAARVVYGHWIGFNHTLQDDTGDKSCSSKAGPPLLSSLPCAEREAVVPCRLFVSGLHDDFTREEIIQIFKNYGQPHAVFRTRNKYQQSIAYLEFDTQCEADTAIAVLNGKPPLHWEVVYITFRNGQDIANQLFASVMAESDFNSRKALVSSSGVGKTTLQHNQPFNRKKEFALERHHESGKRSEVPAEKFRPSYVCGTPPLLGSATFEVPDGSTTGQGLDWPSSQRTCSSPPALEPAPPILANNGYEATKSSSSTGTVTVNNTPDSSLAYSFDWVSAGSSSSFQQDHVGALAGKKRMQQVKVTSPIDSSEFFIDQPRHVSKTIHVNDDDVALSATVPCKSVTVHVVEDVPVHYENCFQDGVALNKTTTPLAVQPTKFGLQLTNSDPKSRSQCVWYAGTLEPPVGSEASSSEQDYGDSLLGAIPKRKHISHVETFKPTTPTSDLLPHNTVPPSPWLAKCSASEFSLREPVPLVDRPQLISVCFVRSPSEFFIHYCAMEGLLTQLLESVKTSVATSVPVVHPVEGLPCLAIYPDDGSWYRAQILRVFPDSIGIRYVDFGNTIKMPANSQFCRMMERSLSEFPFYAVKMKLADVVPVIGSSWDKATNRKFKDIVLNRIFLMEFVQWEGGVMSVRLKNRDGSDLVSRLLQENLVKSTFEMVSPELGRIPSSVGNASLSRCQQLVNKPERDRAQVHEHCNADVSSARDALAKCPSQVSVQTAADCSNVFAATTSMVPSHASGLPLDHDACATELAPPAGKLSSPLPFKRLPGHGTGVRVSTESTLEPANTHAIIALVQVGEKVLFQVTESLAGVAQFSGMLLRGSEDMPVFDFSSLAESVTTVPDFKPIVGSIVSALYPFDNQWYRGCVTKVHMSTYSVLLVDYGNEVDNVVAVQPLPTGFQHEKLSVKLSFVGSLGSATQQFAEESMFPESNHSIEITAKMADESALARFVGENVPTCFVKIEPWTSLLTGPLRVSLPSVFLQPILDICLPKWEYGFSCNVIPLAAEDVDCIHVQADTHATKVLAIKIKRELKEHFSYSVKLSTVPSVGSCVAAILSEDGDLYRARITGINGEAISLTFVDIGQSATSSLGELRVLPNCFYAYPACSVRVSLAHVERPAGCLPTSIQELLGNCVNKRHEMVVVSSESKRPACNLIENGQFLNEKIRECLGLQTHATRNASNWLSDLVIQPCPLVVHAMPNGKVPAGNITKEPRFAERIVMAQQSKVVSAEGAIAWEVGSELLSLSATNEQIPRK